MAAGTGSRFDAVLVPGASTHPRGRLLTVDPLLPCHSSRGGNVCKAGSPGVRHLPGIEILGTQMKSPV